MGSHEFIQDNTGLDFKETAERIKKVIDEIKEDMSAAEESGKESGNRERTLFFKPFPKPGNCAYLRRLINGEAPGKRQFWIWSE